MIVHCLLLLPLFAGIILWKWAHLRELFAPEDAPKPIPMSVHIALLSGFLYVSLLLVVASPVSRPESSIASVALFVLLIVCIVLHSRNKTNG